MSKAVVGNVVADGAAAVARKTEKLIAAAD